MVLYVRPLTNSPEHNYFQPPGLSEMLLLFAIRSLMQDSRERSMSDQHYKGMSLC